MEPTPPPAPLCSFLEAWRGQCGKPVVEGHRYCRAHLGVKCWNEGCSNQATIECANTFQFVCGVPYCSDCGEHKWCYAKVSEANRG